MASATATTTGGGNSMTSTTATGGGNVSRSNSPAHLNMSGSDGGGSGGGGGAGGSSSMDHQDSPPSATATTQQQQQGQGQPERRQGSSAQGTIRNQSGGGGPRGGGGYAGGGGNNNNGGGGGGREYCLRWNNHQPNLVTFFGTLLNKESFVDVTLVSSEGRKIQAHKLVLSACSPYFQHVFENNPCKHPIVILKDIQYADLRTIVSFIYNGEVNISQDRITNILSTASTLQIKGLAEVPADELKRVGGKSNSTESNERRAQIPHLHSAYGSGDGEENLPHTEIPRKKLKKSTGLGGSTSTNGDHSVGGSFESGVGASMSRSIDEGNGIDGGNGNGGGVAPSRAPPPLTAGSQLSQHLKSRSLDTGMAFKQEEAGLNMDSDLSSGGFSESQTYDDSSLGADRGYDLEVADEVKMREGVTDDDEIEFDEELYDHPDNYNNNTTEFDQQSFSNHTTTTPSSSFLHDRQFVASRIRRRVKYPKYLGPQVDNSITTNHKYQQAIDQLLQNPSLTFREAATQFNLNASSVWYHYRMKYGYRRKVEYENDDENAHE